MKTEKEVFDEWYYSDDDQDLWDNAPSADNIDEHHKYWMFTAWQASRKVAFEDAAKQFNPDDGAWPCRSIIKTIKGLK